MNRFHVVGSIIFFYTTISPYAAALPLENIKNKITFYKMGTGDYFLKEDPQRSVCKQYADDNSRNMLIRVRDSTTRSYQERKTNNACLTSPQQSGGIVTTARKTNNFELPCRIGVMTELINNIWAPQMKVEPYSQDSDNLCTGNTLIKSASCIVHIADSPNRSPLDCHNKFVCDRFNEIEIMLDNPDFDISETSLNSPFDLISFTDTEPLESNYVCRFKFCRIWPPDMARN